MKAWRVYGVVLGTIAGLASCAGPDRSDLEVWIWGAQSEVSELVSITRVIPGYRKEISPGRYSVDAYVLAETKWDMRRLMPEVAKWAHDEELKRMSTDKSPFNTPESRTVVARTKAAVLLSKISAAGLLDKEYGSTVIWVTQLFARRQDDGGWALEKIAEPWVDEGAMETVKAAVRGLSAEGKVIAEEGFFEQGMPRRSPPCDACHKRTHLNEYSGIFQAGTPELAGKPFHEVIDEMAKFLDGRRQDKKMKVMNEMAAGLPEHVWPAVAIYYATR